MALTGSGLTCDLLGYERKASYRFALPPHLRTRETRETREKALAGADHSDYVRALDDQLPEPGQPLLRLPGAPEQVRTLREHPSTGWTV